MSKSKDFQFRWKTLQQPKDQNRKLPNSGSHATIFQFCSYNSWCCEAKDNSRASVNMHASFKNQIKSRGIWKWTPTLVRIHNSVLITCPKANWASVP